MNKSLHSVTEYMELSKKTALDERSKYLRKLIISSLKGGERGHLGSSMSLVEILRVIYDDFLRFDVNKPDWSERDQCILSKGHGCLTLYALLADKGFIEKDMLKDFCKYDSSLGGHPEFGKVPGVEASTGALGHGLSIGVGKAIAARIKKRDTRIVVVTGDGELNEGSVWEAAMSASKHGLDNLVVMVDYNKLQSYGFTSEVLDLEPLRKKWEAFGFAVEEVNGHDVGQIQGKLSTLPFEPNKPSVIICHTVKGKGFPFAEYEATWHHKSRIDDEMVEKMQKALEEYS